MKKARSTSSTAVTSVYNLRPNPRRVLSELKSAAGVERLRNGEFNTGEVIPGTRYRLIGLLGVGGMGSVYEVEHVELGKRFVLKALLSELAMREDLVARLRNEQRALGRLEHPNIVAVTDAGMTAGNVPYFVMERLGGETLGARLKRLTRLPVPEALGIVAGVLEGLAAAHEIGIVHRDVKPQNILLVGGKHPKILDFGVAKVQAPGGAITARGVAIGTPRYMSPEQASGEAVDGRSDLYALGLVLFESIVGKGPFDDVRDANEMLLAHLSRPAPGLSSLVSGVTRELDDLAATLLAKDPAERPPKARAAAAGVRAVLRRYGGMQALEALTPRAGYSSTTRMFGVPLAREAPTTDAEAPAARAQRAAEAATNDATTLARDANAGLHDTWIDDATGKSSGSDWPLAPGITRTEVLSVVNAPRVRGDDETNTRVPLTPVDGSLTLAPIPVVAPSSVATRGSRRLLFAVGVGALAVGAGLVVAVTLATPKPNGPATASREPGAITRNAEFRAPPPTLAPVAAEPVAARPAPAAPVSVSTAAPGPKTASSGEAAQKPAKIGRRGKPLPGSGL